MRAVDGLHEALHWRVTTGGIAVHLHHHLRGTGVRHERLDRIKLAPLAVNFEQVDGRRLVSLPRRKSVRLKSDLKSD